MVFDVKKFVAAFVVVAMSVFLVSSVYSVNGVQSPPEERVYLFDMDGTLTPSRSVMEEDFAKWFSGFIKENRTYIVTGSDIGKIKEQIPADIFNKIEVIFASMGNEMYRFGEIVERHDFTPPPALIKILEKFRRDTKYPGKLYPNYIEKRCGMINFCVVGRDCPTEARAEYGKWDAVNHERLANQKYLAPKFKELDFVIGGAISMDIVPKGLGKEQVAARVREMHPKALIIFAGDSTRKGGNDYALAQELLQIGNCRIVAVTDPADTLKQISEISQK
jgi:phosphomannomutase